MRSLRLALPLLGALLAPAQAATFVVSTSLEAGPGSLRDALALSNAISGYDTIEFAVGSGPISIAPTVPLPDITDPVMVDACTQPGWTSNPIVELRGTWQSSGSGLKIAAGGTGSLIRCLVVNRFPEHGLKCTGADDVIVTGVWLGLDLNGITPRPNLGNGGDADDCFNFRLGGTAASGRVVASGNAGYGFIIRDSDDLTIWNAYFGLRRDGTADAGNGLSGFKLHQSGYAEIGGAGVKRVVTSGNGLYGWEMGGPLSTLNVFIGYSGTDATGMYAVPNDRSGAVLFNAPYNQIGGLGAGECALFSGNKRAGLTVDGDHHDGVEWSGIGWALGNEIVCGYFGTDKTGNAAVPNWLRGILLFHARLTLVGLAVPGSEIIVSGNDGAGILMLGEADHSDLNQVARQNWVQGAKIGVGKNGAALGNAWDGVYILNGQYNHIGASDPATWNIIKFNGDHGVEIAGTNAATNTVSNGNTITNNASNPQIQRMKRPARAPTTTNRGARR